FAFDPDTGQLLWKLGGSARPESLTFAGDPIGQFHGQHYARFLSDGTITLHDNETGASPAAAPRAVRYQLDLTSRTATLLEQVHDPIVSTSSCCGSAKRTA